VKLVHLLGAFLGGEEDHDAVMETRFELLNPKGPGNLVNVCRDRDRLLQLLILNEEFKRRQINISLDPTDRVRTWIS
jgi:hypothetical protein